MAAPPVMHAPAPISTGGRQPSPFTSNRPAPAIHHILRLHMAQPEHFQTGQFVTCSYCYSIQSHLESHGSSYAPAGQSQYQGAYTMANNFGLPASPPASHGGYGEQQYGFGTSSTYNNNDNMSIPAPAPASFGQDRDEPDNNPFSMFLPAPAPTSQFQDSEQTNETNSMDYNNSNYYNMAIQDPAPASFGQNGDQPYDYHPNLNNPNLAMAAPECPAAL